MLAIKVLDLISVELWHIVVLKYVEDSFECLIEQVTADPTLLVLLSCGWIIWSRWHSLHILVPCHDLLELLIDDEAGDLLSEG